jgi:hypothetical protein
MGEPYSKSWKKGVLIEKVRAAREKANNTTCTAPVRNTVTTGHKRLYVYFFVVSSCPTTNTNSLLF